MFLNETKPPLDEALAHYGVKGMHWGKRRSRSSSDDYDDMLEQERHERNKKRVATAGLVAVGAVATVAILHKTGHVKVSPSVIASGKSAFSKLTEDSPAQSAVRSKARSMYEASKAARKERKAYTWRLDEVRNPLWTVNTKKSKRSKATGLSPGLAETFSQNGVFKIHSMDDNIWATPASFYAGRR